MQRKSISLNESIQDSTKDSLHLTLDLEAQSNTDAESDCSTEIELGQKIRHGSVQSAIWGFFSDYCYNSTIHGMKYLGERRRPWIERIWWGIVFVTSIFMCSKFIWSSWKEWQQSPVIVTFAGKTTPIWQIPFPAVTICPEIKVKTEYLNFTQAYNSYAEYRDYFLTENERHRLEVVYQTCNFNLLSTYLFSDDGDIILNDTFIETLKEMSPTEQDTFYLCNWRNNLTDCTSFVPILTDDGFCFTFNMLNASALYRPSALHGGYEYPIHERKAHFWSLEDGYDNHAPMETYPQRALGAGARGGLYIWLQVPAKDTDYLCRGAMQGFKILLHSPDEVPQVARHYFRIPLNQEITVTVKPNMLTTSDGLRDYEPSRRQCYFNQERELQFFQIYTQRNCELECLSLFTKEKCGCVKFSMPRDAATPICGARQVACYHEAEYELLQMEIAENLSKDSDKSRCNCLPACTSIVYDAETSQTDAEWKELFKVYDFSEEFLTSFHSVSLSIYFKDTHFITSRRSELHGLIDFIANCGGLLGLFMGVSLLSIIEIVYFCSIRLHCNLRMRMRSNRMASNENIPIEKSSKALV